MTVITITGITIITGQAMIINLPRPGTNRRAITMNRIKIIIPARTITAGTITTVRTMTTIAGIRMQKMITGTERTNENRI